MRYILFIWILVYSISGNAQPGDGNIRSDAMNASNSDNIAGYLNLSKRLMDADPGKALINGRKALRRSDTQNSSLLRMHVYLYLGKGYFLTNQIDSALYYTHAGIKLAEAKRNPTVLYTGNTLLGNIFLAKAKFDEAKSFFDKALAIDSVNGNITHRAPLYAGLSNYYFKRFDFTKSMNSLNHGISLAREEKDNDALMHLYSNKGNLLLYMRKLDSADNYLNTAMSHFRKIGSVRNEAIINQHRGVFYGSISNFAKMEEYLTSSEKQFKSIGNNHDYLNTMLQKANAYFTGHRFESCMNIINRVEPAAARQKNSRTSAICYLFKSGIFSLLEDTVTANRYISLYNNIRKHEDHPGLDKMNTFIQAIIHSAKSKIAKGDSLLKQGLMNIKASLPPELARSAITSAPSLPEETDKKAFTSTYDLLLPADSVTADHAYDNFTTQNVQTNMNAVYNKQITDLEIRYQTKQKIDSLALQGKTLALNQQEIDARKKQLFYLISASILVLIFALIVYRYFWSAKKAKEKIELLQRELHHRVRNNLGVITRLIEVSAKEDGAGFPLTELSNQVKSIAFVHEHLTNSSDVSILNMQSFLLNLVQHLDSSMGGKSQIEYKLDADVSLPSGMSTPLALIINELVTNSIKYAFPDIESKVISVNMKETRDGIIMNYQDNGVGYPNNAKDGYGSKLIRGLSGQINGKNRSWNDNGYHFEMLIKV